MKMDLAAEGAMNIRFLKTPIAGSAEISRPFELAVLRSFLDEHNLGTVYGVSLLELLDLINFLD